MDMQDRIEKYWTNRADAYSTRTCEELQSSKKEAWKDIILKHAPQKDSLRILDIGTGPGFFPIILSQQGHHVTGIDCCDNMLAQARQNAYAANVTPDFKRMDCHALEYEDASFDLVLSRNLTWTLENPEAAYAEWTRVLKPGGHLLIFDANWYLHLYDTAQNEKYQAAQNKSRALGVKDPHEGADTCESENIGRTRPLSQHHRPQWDISTLGTFGFTDVYSQTNISDHVWDDSEKVAFEATPMFLVRACKPLK